MTHKLIKHKQVGGFMKFIIFHLYLKSIIKKNYAARKAGKLKDEWFWADRLACEWGYFVGAEK